MGNPLYIRASNSPPRFSKMKSDSGSPNMPSNTQRPTSGGATKPSAAHYANARRIMYWTCAAIPVALALLVLLDADTPHLTAKVFRYVSWAMTASISFIAYGAWRDIEAASSEPGN